MAHHLFDFPRGPLDYYRNKATFDWKQLKVFMYSEEVVEFEQKLYEELQKQSTFVTKDALATPSLEEQRKMSTFRMLNMIKFPLFSYVHVFENVKLEMIKIRVLFNLDPSAIIKNSIAFGMFPSAVQSLGTERHIDYVVDSLQNKIIGGYCLTEIGHGSNAKFLQTTATYDKETEEFILHSPTFEAAKCWAGNVADQIDRFQAYGRIAFSSPYNRQPLIDQRIRENNQTIFTPLITLDTPRKATVRVIILADPYEHEICFVEDTKFRELSKPDADGDG